MSSTCMSPGRGLALLLALLPALLPRLLLAAEPHDRHPHRPVASITVLAAASLTGAFNELGGIIAAQEGITVSFSLAGSQQLAAQIEHGIEADLFASADERWMSHVKARGLLDGDPVTFAENRLAVIVPGSNPARIDSLGHLSRRGVKVVLAAEGVPAGRYSREALEKLARAPGFPSDFAAHVLANVVSEEENVKSVVAKVQIGEADAGIVYRSDVNPAVARHVRVIAIEEPYNVTVRYPIALLRAAPGPEAARRLIDLVLSPQGQAVLEKHGLLPVRSRNQPSLDEERPSP